MRENSIYKYQEYLSKKKIMINFYQHTIWREINEHVYHRKVFEHEFLGKKYFGVIRQKKKFGITTQRYQILGIDANLNDEKIKDEIAIIKKKFCSSRGTIFFQLGSTFVLEEFSTKKLTDRGFVDTLKNKRIDTNDHINKLLGLKKSFIENMPPASIIVDLEEPLEVIEKNFSNSMQQNIKKGKKNNLEFCIADDSDREKFYQLRKNTGENKGFGVIGKQTFLDLKTFLFKKKTGHLFVVKKNNEIVSGSIILLLDHELFYLYGATNRTMGRIGGNQYLKYCVIQWAKDHGFTSMDLLGAGPTGFSDHSLSSVGEFKEGFGGNKIEYQGSFDIVGNRLLYKLFQRKK